MILASLASPDALPGIATWRVLRQPCVFQLKYALSEDGEPLTVNQKELPDEVGLTSLFSRERSERLDNALSQRSLFARRSRNWPRRRRDWPPKVTGLRQQTGFENLPCEAGLASWHDLSQPCVPG